MPFPIEVRTVASDDALLSTAAGRDSGFVAVHMFEGMEWRPYFEAVEAIMVELEGRPHWGKRHFQTASTLRARYPEWDRFQAVRARLDPSGLFANAWTDRVLGREWKRDECGEDRGIARRGGRRERRRTAAQSYARLERATAGLQAPFALIDLDAMGANAADLERRAAPASRSGSQASRCAAARCRNGCSSATAFAGTLAFTLQRRCGSPSHGGEDIARRLPDGRHGARCARSPSAGGCAGGSR